MVAHRGQGQASAKVACFSHDAAPLPEKYARLLSRTAISSLSCVLRLFGALMRSCSNLAVSKGTAFATATPALNAATERLASALGSIAVHVCLEAMHSLSTASGPLLHRIDSGYNNGDYIMLGMR